MLAVVASAGAAAGLTLRQRLVCRRPLSTFACRSRRAVPVPTPGLSPRTQSDPPADPCRSRTRLAGGSAWAGRGKVRPSPSVRGIGRPGVRGSTARNLRSGSGRSFAGSWCRPLASLVPASVYGSGLDDPVRRGGDRPAPDAALDPRPDSSNTPASGVDRRGGLTGPALVHGIPDVPVLATWRTRRRVAGSGGVSGHRGRGGPTCVRFDAARDALSTAVVGPWHDPPSAAVFACLARHVSATRSTETTGSRVGPQLTVLCGSSPIGGQPPSRMRYVARCPAGWVVEDGCAQGVRLRILRPVWVVRSLPGARDPRLAPRRSVSGSAR